MIHRAKFQNFKALRDVEVTFDSRLTVLVGPNGSGKTSVLQGIHALCSVCQASIPNSQQYNVNSLVPCLSAGTKLETFEIQGTAKDSNETCVALILPTSKLANNRGMHHSAGLGLQIQPLRNKTIPSSPNNNQAVQAAEIFGSSALLRLDVNKLAAPSQPNAVPPAIQSDGTGLASTLAYQLLNQPERFDEIVAAFKRVIGSVERLRFDKVPGSGFSDILLFDYRGARGIRAEHASTGTLLTLGLLAVVLGPRQPRVVLLDDLDQGLHPKAQMELIEVLRTLLAQYPDLQIIATSHSPYILDKLAWNEVRVTVLNEDGSAVCAPLTEHPLYERWKDSMSPGEFWSHGGEDWVKQLSPQTTAP